MLTDVDLPTHKFDIAVAQKLVDYGMPAVEPILYGILEWFQDYNWPVAHTLEPLFDGMGEPIVPYIQNILSGDDDLWKYWIVVVVIPKLAISAQDLLIADIKRILDEPTEGEIREELVLEAKEYLLRKQTIG